MTKKIISLFIVVIAMVAVFYFWQTIQTDNKATISDYSFINVKDRGKLIVGGDVPYGVMEGFNEEGEIVGIDIDITKEIASRMGVELEYIDYNWEPLFDAIKNGEIDFAASALSITPERKEDMMFSSPYFNGGQIILIKDENKDIKKADDLAGKKVGVQVESTGYDAVLNYTEKDMIKTYEDTSVESKMIKDLKNGNIDAVVIDYIAAVSLAKEAIGFRIAGDPFTQEFYGFASKLGNNALVEKINEILRDMKREGVIRSIQDKWVR